MFGNTRARSAALEVWGHLHSCKHFWGPWVWLTQCAFYYMHCLVCRAVRERYRYSRRMKWEGRQTSDPSRVYTVVINAAANTDYIRAWPNPYGVNGPSGCLWLFCFFVFENFNYQLLATKKKRKEKSTRALVIAHSVLVWRTRFKCE